VSRYKGRGKDLDLQEVGRQLNVQAVVTGKLTQRKEGLSLSIELVDVRDLRGIWMGQYDRTRTDIQMMQEEISKQICVKLGLQLTSEEQKRLTKRHTDNPEAYQLYLKGRYFWNKRTPELINKAISYFKQAIDTDPIYALAYAGLADCYIVPDYPHPPREKMPKAKAAALKALELDDMLAEAHTTLARVLTIYDWNWLGAKKEFERAIELNPRYAVAHQWYGEYWIDIGRLDEGIAENKRAQELDPLSLNINFMLALAFYHAGQYDQAIEQFKKTLEMDPNFPAAHTMLPAAYEQKEMYPEAITGFQNAITLTRGFSRSFSMAGLGHLYGVSGKKGEAQKVLNELRQLSGHEYVPAHEIALIYAGLGEKDEAFTWLENAYEERSFNMMKLKVEPRWRGLRTDPRFVDLLRRMGLQDKSVTQKPSIDSEPKRGHSSFPMNVPLKFEATRHR
jgi:tetratricopeptide (TPR) repeat protein